jgi:hypothetical protein
VLVDEDPALEVKPVFPFVPFPANVCVIFLCLRAFSAVGTRQESPPLCRELDPIVRVRLVGENAGKLASLNTAGTKHQADK